MNPLKGIKIVTLMIALVFIIGCAGTPIRFGSDTGDPNFDRTNIDYSKGHEIEASASGFQLFLVIPILINRHEEAYQRLRERAASDYITDIRIEESWTYCFVGTLYTTTIKAIAYPHKTN